MNKLTTLSLIIVTALLAYGGNVVNAQGSYSASPYEPDGSEDWCYTFDFKIDDYSWAVYSGQGDGRIDGKGWRSERTSDNGYYNNNLYISLYLPLDTPLYRTSIYLTSDSGFTFPNVSGYDSRSITAHWVDDGNETFYSELSEGHPTNVWLNSDISLISSNADSILFTANPRSSEDYYIEQIYISGFGTPPGDFFYPDGNECGTGIIQPIKQSHRQSHDPLQHPDTGASQLGIITGADDSNATVHAVTDGEVFSITPLDAGTCNPYFFTDNYNVPMLRRGCDFITRNTLYALDYQNASLVSILADDGTNYTQLVNNADNYVIEGQTVTAGCWLGKVVNASNILGGTQPVTATWSLTGFSTFNDVIPDNIEDADEPPESSECFKPDGFTQCLGDTRGADASKWSTDGTVFLEDGKFILFNGSSVTGTFNLDSTREPELIVGHWDKNNQVVLQLGQTILTTIFNNGKATISGAEHLPDAGDLYTVKVKNNEDTHIQIDYICVRHTKDTNGDPIATDTNDTSTGDPPAPDNVPQSVETCVFYNNAFNNGSESWTISGSVVPATGAMNIPHNQTITQSVTTDETKTLSIIASVWSYNTYTPDPTDTTGTIELEYDTGSGYTSIATKTMADFASKNNIIIFQDDVDSFSGDFTLRPTLTSTPADVRGIAIQSVCLNADGELDENGTASEDDLTGIFTAQCNTQLAVASGDNLFTWVPWLWSNLNKFFTCDLMILLNKMYRLAVDSYTLFGWSMRYAMSVSDMAIDWMGTNFVPWLGGYLSNISPSNITVNEAEETCHDLFCVITSFFDLIQYVVDLINGILTSLMDIIGSLLTLGIDIVRALLDLITSFFALLQAIVNSYLNATPVAIPYAPVCSSEPKSNGLCIGLWMLEHTIFSTSGGSLLIPILISYGSIVWILYAAKEIRQIVIATGRGL